MTCVICKNGETEPGVTTSTLKRDSTIIFVTKVPANVCNNCGEAYIDSQTLVHLHNMSPENSERDDEVEVSVLKYATANSSENGDVGQVDKAQRQHALEFIRELGLTSRQYEKKEFRGGYRLYVSSHLKRLPKFGSVRLNIRGPDAGKLVVYATGDFFDPRGRFTAQPKNPKDAWYKFWPDDNDAMRYAAKVVRSAYQSRV